MIWWEHIEILLVPVIKTECGFECTCKCFVQNLPKVCDHDRCSALLLLELFSRYYL